MITELNNLPMVLAFAANQTTKEQTSAFLVCLGVKNAFRLIFAMPAIYKITFIRMTQENANAKKDM